MEHNQIKNWLKENWFKAALATGVIITGVSVFYYFVILSYQKEVRIQEQARIDLIAKNNKEAQFQEQARLDLIEKNKLVAEKSAKEALVAGQKAIADKQKATFDTWVNQCISDAYTELKTLQGNRDYAKWQLCAKGNCDVDYWNKIKESDFTTYQNEWVPQCKLGNKVFIHYEPMQ